MELTDIIKGYYRNDHVRKRIFEFLGGTGQEDVTSRFITGDGRHQAMRRPRPASELPDCLEEGMEICRSLWDERSLVAHLDIEYVNFDFPGEAYLKPDRIFKLQTPVLRSTKRLLEACGITPLHILSGRGHHFVWQIPQNSEEFRNLAEIGSGPPSALQIESRPKGFDGKPILPELTEAFEGLALVMELLAHEIKEDASSETPIPVELTAVEAGPSECGREMISIDISEYGDPLQSRATRVPFSAYLKPWQNAELVGQEVLSSLPPIFFIPLQEMSVDEGIEVMRDAGLASKLASRVRTMIPVQCEGMARLIRKYLGSTLRKFHLSYYSHRHHPPAEWVTTYDQFSIENLPSCARLILSNPNDALLKPSGLRLVVRLMLALGWHPRHIAGLIRSKFEKDYQWGTQWEDYDPAMRADFYTRVFAGLFALWRDDLVDFNCQSTKEEKLCSNSNCLGNLDFFRQSALSRRRYGHLAHRPFNRLFLPTQHL